MPQPPDGWLPGPPFLAEQDTSDAKNPQIGRMPFDTNDPHYGAVDGPRQLSPPGLGRPPFLAHQDTDDSGYREAKVLLPTDARYQRAEGPIARPLPWSHGPPVLAFEQDPSTRQQIGTDPLPPTNPFYADTVTPTKPLIPGTRQIGPPILANQAIENDLRNPQQIGTTGDPFQVYEQHPAIILGSRPFQGGPPILVVQPSWRESVMRLSQAPVDVLSKPTSQAARISQAPVDVLYKTTSKARLSQAPVDVLIRNQYDVVTVDWSDG